MLSGESQTSRHSPKQTFIGIQYLRAAAAFTVVLHHVGTQLLKYHASFPWPRGLTSGVDLFFVISGLIMWITTNTKTVSPGSFLHNRAVRIIPLYWIMTTLSVVILARLAPPITARQ